MSQPLDARRAPSSTPDPPWQHLARAPAPSEAIYDANGFTSAILDAIGSPVIVLDASGTIVWVNAAANVLVGLPADELEGRPFWARFADGEGVATAKDAVATLVHDGFPHTFEGDVRSHNGSCRLMAWSGTTLSSATGEVASVVVTGLDITARSRAERELGDERSRAEAELAHQATHDSLTGLPNRVLLGSCVRDALASTAGAAERASGVAVLFMDLDHFKVINDSLGHDAGDQVLVEIARRLRSASRPGDIVARLGGDEFVVVCEGLGSEDEARAVAERLHAALQRPAQLSAGAVSITASIGIAMGTAGSDVDSLLRDADTAMYQAKDGGRNRHQVFREHFRVKAIERLRVERILRRALDDGHLRLVYQPIVSLDTGELASVEALLRIDDPEHGLIAPSEFIDIAEESGLIVPIGAGVLEEACRQSAAWDRELGEGVIPRIAVNLSARQMSSANLVQVVARALELTGARPSALALEITESALMDATAATVERLGALREMGVEVGIDDFGTGYSSLTYLKSFPVSFLKIDRSFVERLGFDHDDEAIVGAVIALAHALDVRVVAEGIEEPVQRERLAAHGCDFGQGYLFARPSTPAAIEAMVQPPGMEHERAC